MQKYKKLLCLLLSGLLLASCFTAAFAAQPEEQIEETRESVPPQGEADGGFSVGVDEKTAQLFEAYNELTSSPAAEEAKAQLTAQIKGFLGEAADFTVQAAELLSQAAEKSVKAYSSNADIAAVEKLIENYQGKLSIKKAEEIDSILPEDIAGYESILASFNALTTEQKEQVNILLFDKLLSLVYDREMALYLVDNPKASTSARYKAVHPKIYTVLGDLPSLKAAETAGAVINDSKKSAEEKLAAFENAGSMKARIYSGLYYSSYKAFYYRADSNFAKGFNLVVTALQKEAVKANPFTEEAPEKVANPKPADYEKGEEDEAYIAALEKYNAYKLAKAEYDARKANYEGALYIEAMEKAGKAALEFSHISVFAKKAVNAAAEFEKDHSKYTLATEAKAYYDKLSADEQLAISQLNLYVWAYATESSYGYTTSKKQVKDLYKFCTEMEDYRLISEFEKQVAAVKESYTADDLQRLTESYNALPSSYKGDIAPEAAAKYEEIMLYVLTHNQSDEAPDLSAFKRTEVNYPFGISRPKVENALPELDKKLSALIAGDGAEDLTGFVAEKLYTNATVGMLASKLYPLLGGLTSLIAYSPDQLADALTEPEYAKAAAALREAAAQNTGDDKLAGWQYLTLENGDMFEDGDREAFLDALSAMFRKLSLLTMVISLENKFSPATVSYSWGAYEDLVPIFEALGVEFMSSVEYTGYVDGVIAENSAMGMDARFRPILETVCNLIDSIAAAPATALSQLLPKLSFALKTDLIDTQIHKLTSKIKMVTLPEFSLKTGDLFDLIAPLLADLEINGKKLNLTLDKQKFIDFVNDAAGCGEIQLSPSRSGFCKVYADVVPNKPDAFVTAFEYLYGELTTDDNLTAIENVLVSEDASFIEKIAIKSALKMLGALPYNTALSIVLGIVDPPKFELPDFDFDFGGGNGNKPDNEPNSNPDTQPETTVPEGTTEPENDLFGPEALPNTAAGKVTGIAVSALALTAGVTVACLKLKKRDNEE